MMYPRLKLARNLLKDDGVIFISIDDNEASNMRKLCDEIFGEENFIAQLVCFKMNRETHERHEKKKPQMDMDEHGLDKTTENTENTEVGFNGLIGLFEQTQTAMQKQAAKSVDIALVVRNWLFGWYIVEFENEGAERAELYGKELIKQLSEALKKSGLKGMSQTNLKQFRLFYEAYKKIGQALPDQSEIPVQITEIAQALPAQSFIELSKIRQATPDQSQRMSDFTRIVLRLYERFVLGWTHYVTLLTVKNVDERRFYELEAAENGWGYRELERQISSALYGIIIGVGPS